VKRANSPLIRGLSIYSRDFSLEGLRNCFILSRFEAHLRELTEDFEPVLLFSRVYSDARQ
jgi:hypothetical protein